MNVAGTRECCAMDETSEQKVRTRGMMQETPCQTPLDLMGRSRAQ